MAKKSYKDDENFQSGLLNIAYPIPEESEYPDLYKKESFLGLLKSYKRLRYGMWGLILLLGVLTIYQINWGFE